MWTERTQLTITVRETVKDSFEQTNMRWYGRKEWKHSHAAFESNYTMTQESSF